MKAYSEDGLFIDKLPKAALKPCSASLIRRLLMTLL